MGDSKELQEHWVLLLLRLYSPTSFIKMCIDGFGVIMLEDTNKRQKTM